MSTYAVGDIQGCFEPFKRLLLKINFNADKDRIWSVGDLVNRGAQSLETLRWFYQHRDNVNLVLGNHDLHLLAISAGVREPTQKDKFDGILKAADRETLIKWLHYQPLVHQEGQTVMVHAGIPPIWNLKETLGYASEVESILQGEYCHEFLLEMYGNCPYVWRDDLLGMPRLRVITNYLTRMRYCTRKGKLDLLDKGYRVPAKNISDKTVAPWFSHKNRLEPNHRVIFGHWAALQGMTNNSSYIGLDTGCVWGNSLTCFELETGRMIQCSCSEQKLKIEQIPLAG